MKVTLVGPSLGPGGAERVMSILANAWAAEGWQITVATFDAPTVRPFFHLDPSVRHITLDLQRNSRNTVQKFTNTRHRVRVLRDALRQNTPDLVVSFVDSVNVATLLASRGASWPVVVAERSNPTLATGRPWKLLRRLTYRNAAAVVVQTGGAARYFETWLPGRLVVIPNPVESVGETTEPPELRLNAPGILSIGRLTEEKQFDHLISAFHRISSQRPDWSLTILGDGPLRSMLLDQVARLNLGGRVSLPGLVGNPATVLRQADLYVLCSRFEGFPNALCEAMAAGLPVVATDCPFGPGEIIRDGVDGVLVPPGDVAALASAMNRLMSDGKRRAELGRSAAEITRRFGVDRVMAQWDDLLHGLGTAGEC